MTAHYIYSSPTTPYGAGWSVDLGTQAVRLGDVPGLVTAALVGDIGQNALGFDDPTSTLGYMNDGILGLKTFQMTETDCAAIGADGVNGHVVFHGYVTDREYARGGSTSPSLRTGTARRIDATLTDVNALAGFRVIINGSNTITGTVTKASGNTTVSGSGTAFLTELGVGSTISIPGGGGTDVVYVGAIASDTSLTVTTAPTHSASGQTALRIDGNRPAETDLQRVRWLLSGVPAYFPATDDAGYVDTTGGVNMDACDYRMQTPADVLHDCAIASGRNWFVLYWEATGTDALWYSNSNTSTKYTSALALSNVLADVDNTTTFAYEPDMRLHRSPLHTYAGVAVQGAGGTVYATQPTTAATYAWRDGTAPSSNIKTLAQLTALADRLVADAAGEVDTITCDVYLPSSLATGIKAGQRVQFKASHLGFNASNTSYTAFTWMRATRVTVAAPEKTDKRYKLSLELSPMQVITCSASLAAAVTGTGTDTQNWGTSTITTSASITGVTSPSLLLGILACAGVDTPKPAYLQTPSGFTLLDAAGNVSSNNEVRVPILVAYKSGASGSYTVGDSFTGGFAINGWSQMLIAFQSNASAPVQHASAVLSLLSPSLSASPTPGNVLIWAYAQDVTTPDLHTPMATPTGWTKIIDMNIACGGDVLPATRNTVVGLFYRCVQAGDPTQWSLPPGQVADAQSSLSEWAL